MSIFKAVTGTSYHGIKDLMRKFEVSLILMLLLFFQIFYKILVYKQNYIFNFGMIILKINYKIFLLQ